MKAATEGSLTVAADLAAGGVKHSSRIMVFPYSSFISFLTVASDLAVCGILCEL
jgi:hypothetical protein